MQNTPEFRQRLFVDLFAYVGLQRLAFELKTNVVTSFDTDVDIARKTINDELPLCKGICSILSRLQPTQTKLEASIDSIATLLLQLSDPFAVANFYFALEETFPSLSLMTKFDDRVNLVQQCGLPFQEQYKDKFKYIYLHCNPQDNSFAQIRKQLKFVGQPAEYLCHSNDRVSHMTYEQFVQNNVIPTCSIIVFVHEGNVSALEEAQRGFLYSCSVKSNKTIIAIDNTRPSTFPAFLSQYKPKFNFAENPVEVLLDLWRQVFDVNTLQFVARVASYLQYLTKLPVSCQDVLLKFGLTLTQTPITLPLSNFKQPQQKVFDPKNSTQVTNATTFLTVVCPTYKETELNEFVQTMRSDDKVIEYDDFLLRPLWGYCPISEQVKAARTFATELYHLGQNSKPLLYALQNVKLKNQADVERWKSFVVALFAQTPHRKLDPLFFVNTFALQAFYSSESDLGFLKHLAKSLLKLCNNPKFYDVLSPEWYFVIPQHLYNMVNAVFEWLPFRMLQRYSKEPNYCVAQADLIVVIVDETYDGRLADPSYEKALQAVQKSGKAYQQISYIYTDNKYITLADNPSNPFNKLYLCNDFVNIVFKLAAQAFGCSSKHDLIVAVLLDYLRAVYGNTLNTNHQELLTQLYLVNYHV